MLIVFFKDNLYLDFSYLIQSTFIGSNSANITHTHTHTLGVLKKIEMHKVFQKYWYHFVI